MSWSLMPCCLDSFLLRVVRTIDSWKQTRAKQRALTAPTFPGHLSKHILMFHIRNYIICIYIYIILVFEKLLLGCSGSFLPTFLESSPSTFFDARPLYLSEGAENCFHLPLIIFLWRKGTWNKMQVEVHSWEQGWNLLTPQRFPSQKQISPTGNNVAEFMRWNKSWFYACCAEKTLVSWLSSHDREVLPLTDEGGLIPQRLTRNANAPQ